MQVVRQNSLAEILIVDKEPLIRSSMVKVLTELGYVVRSAHDGFSALVEVRRGIPDIVLCDLNTPGMSGFEFLSVVHHQFPSVRVIVMSGTFSGDEARSGVAADAFYPKGSSVRSLLKIIEGLAPSKRSLANPPAASSQLWIQPNGNEVSGITSLQSSKRVAERGN